MPAYESATTAEVRRTRGPRRGVVAYRDAVLFWTHGKGTSDLGIYVRRNVRGGSTPSLHAVGRAWDIGGVNANDPHDYGHLLAWAIIASAGACGVTEVIWNRQRWTDAGTRPYNGTDDHTTHIHVGFNKAFADSPATHTQLVAWVSAFVFGIKP